MIIDNLFFEDLMLKAQDNPRLRLAFDLRTFTEEGSQRVVNALIPGTQVPVHRHTDTDETVIVMRGHLTEIFFDDSGHEIERFELNPANGVYGIQIPKGTWHSVIVNTPSIIFEGKHGAYTPLQEKDTLRL